MVKKKETTDEAPIITNPNGANQYQYDPRQKLCWDLYINPKSETFGNAYQSAIKAGYEDATARQITTVEWFIEKRRRLNLLSKAEKVLDETLEMDDTEPILVEGEVIDRKRNPALTKIKQDSAKFLAERLGKEEGYSTRHEMTGKNGENLEPLVVVNYGDIKPPIQTEGVSDTTTPSV